MLLDAKQAFARTQTKTPQNPGFGNLTVEMEEVNWINDLVDLFLVSFFS